MYLYTDIGTYCTSYSYTIDILTKYIIYYVFGSPHYLSNEILEQYTYDKQRAVYCRRETSILPFIPRICSDRYRYILNKTKV